MQKKRVIEWELRNHLEGIGVDKANARLTLLRNLVSRESAMLETIWLNHGGKGKSISVTLFRWLIDVSIWKKNNNIPIHLWNTFIEKVIAKTGGSSNIPLISKDGRANNMTLGISNGLSKLKIVCDILGVPLYVGKRKAHAPRRAGYDDGHITPFATNGDGPTIVEPASLNRARGANPILLVSANGK